MYPSLNLSVRCDALTGGWHFRASNTSWTAIGTITPGLHNKISAYNIFARGWVAQICLFHW